MAKFISAPINFVPHTGRRMDCPNRKNGPRASNVWKRDGKSGGLVGLVSSCKIKLGRSTSLLSGPCLVVMNLNYN